MGSYIIMRELLQKLKEKEATVRLSLIGEVEYHVSGVVQGFTGSMVEVSYNGKSAWVDLGDILIVSFKYVREV